MNPIPESPMSRRKMITDSARGARHGTLLLNNSFVAGTNAQASADVQRPTTKADGPFPPGEPGKDYTPVVTPNGATLPCKVVDGVKVFHLIAEEVDHEFAPGLKAQVLGLQRPHARARPSRPSRAIACASTSPTACPSRRRVHWHGILLPNGMDGVGGPEPASRSRRARRSSTSSRCASTARSCTTRTTTR